MTKILTKKWFYYLIVLPILVTLAFWVAVFKTHDYLEARENTIWKEGYEVGRFDQLNEDAENTQIEIKQKQISSKEDLLKKLAGLESKGGKYRKILDTNNKYSLGLYHFQAGTVKDMYRRFYGKQITILEAVKIAENDELATKLAYDAIFVKKELFHWRISMCKLEMITKGCLTQKQINKLVMK